MARRGGVERKNWSSELKRATIPAPAEKMRAGNVSSENQR